MSYDDDFCNDYRELERCIWRFEESVRFIAEEKTHTIYISYTVHLLVYFMSFSLSLSLSVCLSVSVRY